jgi:membrane protein DedA with SNARE-associated domain
LTAPGNHHALARSHALHLWCFAEEQEKEKGQWRASHYTLALKEYLLLFGLVFAEQIGLPLPAAPVLLAAGALAAAGSLNLTLLVSVALVASVLADYLWYRAGSFRKDAISRFLGRHPDSHLLRGAERFIGLYGSRSLLFAKFVPGVSLAAPPLSGAFGISIAEFLLFDTLGSLIWAGGITGIGYVCGRSFPVSPSACLLLWLALALGLAGIRCGRSLWGKLRTLSVTAAIAHRFARIYNEAPAKLTWLTQLMAGDTVSHSSSLVEPVRPRGVSNQFFVDWMVTWSRKLVIAKALGRVTGELRDSVNGMALAGCSGLTSPLPNDSLIQFSLDRPQIERGLAALDVLPRCAVLLTVFEGLSLKDAAILMGTNQQLVAAAQAIGLYELIANLAQEQGLGPRLRLSPRPTLETLEQTT